MNEQERKIIMVHTRKSSRLLSDVIDIMEYGVTAAMLVSPAYQPPECSRVLGNSETASVTACKKKPLYLM